MTLVVDEAEVAQRVAVLKRFKILLTQQRDRFKSYLNLMDKQQNVIESGNTDDLLTYVEIEEKMVADIFSIQKVIDPLEEMYNAVVMRYDTEKMPSNAENPDEVPDLKDSLERLKNEAVVRSTKNRELLSKRMMELRSEITIMKNNPYLKKLRSAGYDAINSGSMIDISG